MSMKICSDIIGNRTRDLPVCSAVPQPLRHRVPQTDLKARGGGERCIALLFLDLGAKSGGWSAPRPGRFTPGKDPVPILQVAGWASGLLKYSCRYPWNGRLHGPQRRLELLEGISRPIYLY
jgi:hypothetical protein